MGKEGEYADGGRVVSRGLVGRLQPRFSGATLCTPLPHPVYPIPPLLPPLSLSSRCVPRLLCFAAFLCSSSAPKAALKRKIITGKALRTRVRQTAGLTSGITLILVSFGPTD